METPKALGIGDVPCLRGVWGLRAGLLGSLYNRWDPQMTATTPGDRYHLGDGRFNLTEAGNVGILAWAEDMSMIYKHRDDRSLHRDPGSFLHSTFLASVFPSVKMGIKQ